jgi:hypothetical protein
MYRIFKRVFPLLIPLACLIATACGDTDEQEAPAVACGDCAAGNVHKDAELIPDDEPLSNDEPAICYDAWHDDESPDCVIVVEYVDNDSCPFPTEPGVETIVETYTDSENVEHNRRFCALPRLDASLDCDEAASQNASEFGWYYCQDLSAECNYQFRFTGDAIAEITGQGFALHCAACTQQEPAGVDCVVDSQIVGQTCTPAGLPEPNVELISGANFALEISPECGGAPCLGKTRLDSFADPPDIQQHSFCTCRCGDLEGNDHTTNPDLCQCPGESVCEPICEHGTICPEAFQGSFCMPACTANPCLPPQECTPPASGDPWAWTCEG